MTAVPESFEVWRQEVRRRMTEVYRSLPPDGDTPIGLFARQQEPGRWLFGDMSDVYPPDDAEHAEALGVGVAHYIAHTRPAHVAVVAASWRRGEPGPSGSGEDILVVGFVSAGEVRWESATVIRGRGAPRIERWEAFDTDGCGQMDFLAEMVRYLIEVLP